jgi:hypothetical protein
MRHLDSRPVQRLERANVVSQRGIDHREPERVVMHGSQSFDFRALANQDIRVSHPMLYPWLLFVRLQHPECLRRLACERQCSGERDLHIREVGVDCAYAREALDGLLVPAGHEVQPRQFSFQTQ